MESYYNYLKETIEHYPGSIEGHILYLPDIFQLMSLMAVDKSLNSDERCTVLKALGYFLLPNDLIPEATHGPSGYMDDLYICCVCLENLAADHGIELLEKYWKGTEPIQGVIDFCLRKTETDMGLLAPDTLSFCGLIRRQPR